jgi:thiamine-monophosphate kinase
MKRHKSPNETEIIDMIQRMLPTRHAVGGLKVGLGDDAAVFRPNEGEELLFTTDIQVEGVHFRKGWLSGRELGRKLAAVNLSDIAAMGGRPIMGLLSLVVAPDTPRSFLKELACGVIERLDEYRAVLAGGNVSGTQKALVADLTVIGSCKTGKAWKRMCRPGRDAVLIAGELGSARAGLELLHRGRGLRKYRKLVQAFKDPKPLLEVARLLQDEPAVHGAIDVSDGFSTDLVRLCEKGGAGCEIDSSRLPLCRELIEFCGEAGVDPVRWALSGGEDYALILSVGRAKARSLAERITAIGIPAAVVGVFTAGKKKYDLVVKGKRSRFERSGWEHLSSK